MCLPWWWRVTENKGSTPEREPERWLPHPRKAAGAQITQSRQEEVVTKNNEMVLYEAHHRNGYNLNPLTRIYWRASLVPAAAVIPAPIAYTNSVAVKKLVVGSFPRMKSASRVCTLFQGYFCWFSHGAFNRVSWVASTFTLKKLECSKQVLRPE